MIRRTLLAAATVLGVGLAAPLAPAHATTLMKTTEAERIARADLILRGQIVETWTERDDQGRIFTRFMVEPSDVFKGVAPDGPLVVSQLGGELSGKRLHIEGTARFNIGEDVVLLLNHKERFDDWVLVSMVQGKYTVRLDPYTHREVVQQTVVPPHLPYDHRFLPFPAEADKVFIDDLQSKIASVKAGVAGAEVNR